MKIWLVSLLAAALLCGMGLLYFVSSIAHDKCLAAGGRWLGTGQGCDGGSGYFLEGLLSPLAVALFIGIILGVSSAFVQIHALLCGSLSRNSRPAGAGPITRYPSDS